MKALFRRSVALAAVIAMASISTADANRLSSFYGSQFVPDAEQTTLLPTSLFDYGSSASFTAGTGGMSDGNLLFNYVNDGGDWGFVHSANYQGDPSRILYRSWNGNFVEGGPGIGDFVSPDGASGLPLYQVFNVDYVAKTANGAFSVGLGLFNSLDDDLDAGFTEDSATGFALRGGIDTGTLEAALEVVFGSNSSDDGTNNLEGSFTEIAAFGTFEIDANSDLFAMFGWVDGQPTSFVDIDNDTATYIAARLGWAEYLSSNVVADISLDFLSGSDEFDSGDQDDFSMINIPSCGIAAMQEIFWGVNLNFGARASWYLQTMESTTGGTTEESRTRAMDFGYTFGVDKNFDDLNVSLTFDQGEIQALPGIIGDDEGFTQAITARYSF